MSESDLVEVPNPPIKLLYGGSLFLLAFAAFFLICFLFAVPTRRDAALVFFVLAAVLGTLPAARVTRALRQRFAYALRDDGALIIRRGSQHTIRFSEIISISIDRKIHETGMAAIAGADRLITIRYAGGGISLRAFMREDDPSAALVRHLRLGFAQEVRARIDRAGALEGDGWKLDRHALVAGEKRVALSEIGSYGAGDEELQVWRRRSPRPSLRIPLSSPNAYTLHDLLAEMEISGEPPAQKDGIGRLRFKRHGNYRKAAASAALGLLLLVAGGGSIMFPPEKRSASDMSYLVVFLAIAVAALIAGFLMFTARLVVYDRALVTQGRQILFDDVLGMRYRTVNQGIGPYTLALTLRTTASDGVNITVASRGAVDDDLDALCELLAARIAARMSDQIAVSGSIAWGKASRLTRDGIETIAHGDSITIPYEECEIEFQGPYAIASTRSLKRPLRVADLYDWNFQAGLMVIRQRSRGTS